MDYKSRIEQIGGGKKPSKKVSEIVDDYEATLQVIAELEEEIADSDDDTSKQEDDLDELVSEKQKIEVKLEKALVGWEKGIERMDNMHQAMRNKTNPNSQQNKVVNTNATPAPINSPNKIVTKVQAEEVKKGGYGWLIFGGIALILTMGAVNTFKRD
jgi:hypothetical protein